MSKYILEMESITKTFPGVRALSEVTFKVKPGEIHCLVGENGAGKSTLMKVLSGVYPYGTYEGDIVVNGEIQRYKGISDSEAAGIAIIYQELALIPELSVYENIFFGHEIKKGFTVDWNETIVKAKEILEQVGLDLNPATKIRDLSVGKKQLVEIAKALSKDVKLLILDEPTAALNEDDSENLLNLLKDLQKKGVTSIMISHKLKEIVSIADTITVLRDGQTVCSMDASEKQVTEQDIIKHMVGREINNIYPKRENIKFGNICFETRGLTAFDPALGREVLHDININVKKGEIVGIAGLMGAGRTEFALSVFGNTKGYKLQGEILIDGIEKKFRNPKDAKEAGIAYVTEDRKKNGLILIDNIKRNTSLTNLNALARRGIINENEEINMANGYLESINIKAPSIEQRLANLSGGNQQKVSVAKWLFADPNILILDEPTRGIDVGAKFEIYTLMNELIEKGMSIIMISSELLEVLGMSDRIYVMSNGKITGEVTAEEATEQSIMAMATTI